ncbi:MAG: RDD family protein [Opitutaceae bacterium]
MKTRYNELVIQTPEGVQFVHRLASPVSRFIAVAVDTFAIVSFASLISVCIALLNIISADFAQAFYILFYFVFSIGYYILLEMVWRGQTLGKRMMRLRVIDANGLKLKPSQFVLRNLLRFVDSLPLLYFLGGICAIVSARSQRLGDLAAGTVVIRIPDIRPPVLSEFSDNLYNSFRDYPRQEALLRQRISPDQSAIALQALHRRDEMEAAERAQLFATLADAFRAEVEFPGDVASAMSDEQYIRNCVDTIYRVAK